MKTTVLESIWLVLVVTSGHGEQICHHPLHTHTQTHIHTHTETHTLTHTPHTDTQKHTRTHHMTCMQPFFLLCLYPQCTVSVGVADTSVSVSVSVSVYSYGKAQFVLG